MVNNIFGHFRPILQFVLFCQRVVFGVSDLLRDIFLQEVHQCIDSLCSDCVHDIVVLI